MSTYASDEPAAVAFLPDRRRLAVRLALVAGVLGALTFAVTSLPGLADVRERLSDASPGWLIAAGALQLASCLAFVAAFRGVFCHRMPWRMSYGVGMAAQGTNVLLPSGGAGGLALAAWALKRTGMPTERLARRTVAFYVLTSSVNFFTAVIAGLALAIGGDALLWTAGPAAAAALVVAAVLALQRLFTRPREGRTGRVLTALSAGIRDAVRLARAGHPLLPALLGALAVVRLPRVLERAPDVGALCQPRRVAVAA